MAASTCGGCSVRRINLLVTFEHLNAGEDFRIFRLGLNVERSKLNVFIFSLVFLAISERARFVAEEFALQQLLGNSRAIVEVVSQNNHSSPIFFRLR